MIDKINSILKFSGERTVYTKDGKCMIVRKARPNDEFWTLWKNNKEELKQLGLSCGKELDGQWYVSLWKEYVPSNDNISLSKDDGKDLEIDLIKPEGLEYLPFQKAGILYAMNRRDTLLADEMGIGKTIQTLGFINQYPEYKNVIVVCPKSVIYNWVREAEKWLVERFHIIPITSRKSQLVLNDRNFVVINYEQLPNFIVYIKSVGWDVAVIDEAHYIKSTKAQRSHLAKSIKAKRRLRLTGTPLLNRPAEIYNLVEDLEGIKFKNFFSFAMRYCDAYRDNFGWHFDGASNLEELQTILRDKVMIRRLKVDVLKELPGKIRTIVELIPSESVKKLVEKANQETLGIQEELEKITEELEAVKHDKEKYKEAVEKYRKISGVKFSEMSRLRHETALAKVPYAVEHIKYLLESVNKVFVLAHHKDVIEMLEKELIEYNPVKLVGDTKAEDRQKNVDRFQNDANCRVFIGSITAAGIGITLTEANYVVFVEFDWRPGILSQCEDRCLRIGQRNSVFVQHLVFNGSLDINMLRTIIKKQEIIDKALDENTNVDAIELDMFDLFGEIEEGNTQNDMNVDDLDDNEILHKLRLIARLDSDMAQSRNGVGFNKFDSAIGHSLATKKALTPKQMSVARKLVKKYGKQLEILEA